MDTAPKPFMDQDFLLDNEPARRLYHEYAAGMPIYDYHCHLPPAEIASNRRFENLTQIWLAGDHYKWRLMRALGVDEDKITGASSDRDKFLAWARAVPETVRSPVYHWTHMELRNPFGIEYLLDESTAGKVWDRCNEALATEPLRVRGILAAQNVRVVCTTDDPTSALEHHAAIRQSGFPIVVVPTYRPDAALRAQDPRTYRRWIAALERATGRGISGYRDLVEALRQRHQVFHEAGCRLSDHGIEEPYAATYTESQVAGVFRKALDGRAVDELDLARLRTALMVEFGRMDAERGWTLQLHLSALRGANTRLGRQIGPDSGFDSMGDWPIARALARYLDALDADGALPKTVLYGLNPSQNEVFASMAGNFQDKAVRGKIQYGAAWWFNDQLDGMTRQMNALSAMGVLSAFVGMLTDSRSFLSYPRHDYFRRLLCALLGAEVQAGTLPSDMKLLGETVKDISYRNAWRYFGIPGVTP
jgi:glucuronate isomerase